MKTLCLYYSRTDKTKVVMETIAENICADIAEYTDGKDRKGVLGYIGACFVNVRNSLDRVHIIGDIELKDYDRVIIGMPVWVEGPCAIGRALIKKYCSEMPSEVYFVCTHMGTNDYMSKIKAMDGLLGRNSSGQFSIRTKENDYIMESRNIADSL